MIRISNIKIYEDLDDNNLINFTSYPKFIKFNAVLFIDACSPFETKIVLFFLANPFRTKLFASVADAKNKTWFSPIAPNILLKLFLALLRSCRVCNAGLYKLDGL